MNWFQLLNWIRGIAEELVDKGEEVSLYNEAFFLINNMCFSKTGNILTDERHYIAENKTPEQMKKIIQALWEIEDE